MVNPPNPRQTPKSPRLASSSGPAPVPLGSPRTTHPPLHHQSSTASNISTTSTTSTTSTIGGSTPAGGPAASPSASYLHHHPSRKPSIVEILSSPPPLPMDPADSIHHFSLSRHASTSSNRSFSQSGSNVIAPPQLSSGAGSSSIAGLDWSEIPLTELTESNKLISIHSSHSVQAAFETLLEHNLTSVPVSVSKNDPTDLTNCLTFDYSDLNTYLLLIMNKIHYADLSVEEIGDAKSSAQEKHDIVIQNINKAKRGEEVPVEFIIKLHPKNPFIKFNETDTLFSVMETLGNGVHRIAIANEEGNKITGILSQRRLIKYMWENARRFPSLDFYLTSTLQDLKIGSTNPITIYEDQLLIDALHKMFTERVSSLAVIDRSRTLIGNISIVDVKNVTSSKNSHLLFKSVLNFISYNLSQKGIEEGQDQFPIFHVNYQTSLGRVIAKLVATQSHRLWIVDSSRQPSSVSSASGPTNGVNVGYANPVDSSITDKAEVVDRNIDASAQAPTTPTPGTIAAAAAGAVSATAPSQPELGYHTGTGKLVGVVTLTDILGLFATSKGRKTDPLAARNQRRRSSTSTTRSSVESALSAEGIIPPAGISGTGGNAAAAVSGSTSTSNNGRRGSVDASSDVFRKSVNKP
ncbi:Protein SDS23 [Candida viswanathii]|uniref:Protein SDS23 n=1 Tax=Candida viswanathii TaxID=5486 RepID=A0A367YBY6_9ASCO|nr:Protein SDS23 [Candida viswanathii]